ncbi:MAG: transcription elongation factor GreA [Patescibacteria group bacterium]
MNKIKITQSGYQKLVNELENLKKVKRPEVIKRIASARELGDLSENADYDDARDEQSFIEGRIFDLEKQIKNCEITSGINGSSEVVLGAKVTVKANGQNMTFEIVGATEADPMNNKISDKSPIGSALVGMKVNDSVDIQTPRGKQTYKVLKIE